MPSVSSSSAADGSAPSATAPKKYIPPHLRAHQAPQSISSVNSSYKRPEENRYSNHNHNHGYSNSNVVNVYHNSVSNTGVRSHQNFSSVQNSQGDRWSALDDRQQASSANNRAQRLIETAGRASGIGNSVPRNTRPSATGTGWDVRDGRRYISDRENDVFDSDKQPSTGINFDSYDRIPIEVKGRGSEKITSIDHFDDLQVHELLRANVHRVKYSKPTPIQKCAIPTIVGGRDLMACAQTGSGKTAAFLYPIIASLLHNGPPPPPPGTQGYGRKACAYPCCLVLSPTRELAVQTYEEARKFQFGTGIRTVAVYGGSEVKRQLMELDGGCDICVATPGRLVDLLQRKKIKLANVQFFVLDEADRMLDMGFHPQITAIATEYDLPPSPGGRHYQQDPANEAGVQRFRQTVMFSATFPRAIQALAKDFMDDYIYLAVGRVGSTNEFIRQRLQYADDDQKVKLLVKLLRESDKGLIIIFVETKRKADLIEDYLLGQQFPAVSIHGDRSQQEREEALRLFKAGECPILVATDVAARGLDIPHVTHVINYDLPTNIDDYVHRIGRTGRAGNIGCATSFVNGSNKPILRDLLHLLEEAKQEVPSFLPPLVASCTSSSTRMGSRNWTSGGRGGGSSGRGIMRQGDTGGGYRGGGSKTTGDMRYEDSGGSRGGGASGGGVSDWRQGMGGGNTGKMGVQQCGGGGFEQRGTLDAW